MKILPEPIKNWFGFTRRERRSSFILLLIIVFIIGIRYTVPEKNMEIEDMTAGYAALNGKKDSMIEIQLFSFDPNVTSFDTLILLGLNQKEAGTLVNYRKKGGKFHNPEDLKKIYGIDESKAASLIPFVVVSPVTTESVKTDSSRQQRIMIELNSCDSALLVRLPGIGPVLSARIIKYRRLLGSFVSVEQIKEVYGLPEETFELIKGNLYVDTLNITRISINKIGYKELSRIPYLEKYEVSSILKFRELNGKIESMNDLADNKIISSEKAQKIRLYFLFE
jgi:DNA uptake protein ComE-like DNA-binding protein